MLDRPRRAQGSWWRNLAPDLRVAGASVAAHPSLLILALPLCQPSPKAASLLGQVYGGRHRSSIHPPRRSASSRLGVPATARRCPNMPPPRSDESRTSMKASLGAFRMLGHCRRVLPRRGTSGVASRSFRQPQHVWACRRWSPVAVSSRAETIVSSTLLSNKELEPTRSTHFAVGPRGSIQCCAERPVGTATA